MNLPMIISVILATAVVALAAAAADNGAVVWTEGEDFTNAAKIDRSPVADKPVASGGKCLYGPSLDTKDLAVSYTVRLAAPLDAAQVVFRYSRLHWRETMVPAAIRMDLTGPGEAVTKELSFADTKGWGRNPGDWKLLVADVGGLAAGEWTLTLTSLADNNSINMDGFFVAAESLEISAAELAALLRLQITSKGYLGFAANSATIRQDQTPTVSLAVRPFAGGPTSFNAAISQKADAWTALTLAGGDRNDAGTLAVQYALPKLADGAYTLRITSPSLGCATDVPLNLLGTFMSTLDDRVAKLAAFSKKLAADTTPAGQIAAIDFAHATQFLSDGRDTMTKSVAQPAGSAWREHIAEAERMSDPAPLAKNMTLTLAQFEATMKLMQTGKHPYAGRKGQFRRAYKSKATGDMLLYRNLIPDGYAAAESVPMILMLHGGGGNENYFHDMEQGTILRIANQRGYLVVSPKYHRRTQPTYAEDLLQLIELTRRQYPKIDPARIYVTGISMGGGATYRMATGNPDLFAAACVVSGGGDPAVADQLATTPTLFLHGGSDTVVPVSRPKAVAAKLTELGLTHELMVFPGHGHEYHAEQYLTLTLDYFDKAGAKKR